MSTTKPAAKPVAKTVTALAAAAAKVFEALRDAHRDETFYFFALYTTEDGSYAGATAWSEEALFQWRCRYSDLLPDPALGIYGYIIYDSIECPDIGIAPVIHC